MWRRFVLFCVQRYRISNFPWDRRVSLTILQTGFPNKQGDSFTAATVGSKEKGREKNVFVSI